MFVFVHSSDCLPPASDT